MKKRNNNNKLLTLFGTLFGVLNILFAILANFFNLLGFLESHWLFVRNITSSIERGIIWYFLLVIIPFAILLIIHYYFMKRKLLQIDYGDGKLANKIDKVPQLTFRHIEAENEIIELEKTENYGDRGSTDIDQVTMWWHKYRKGNVIALYKGKIIGGIDMWPITNDFYNNLLSGRSDEEDLKVNEILAPSDNKESYWYIASISLSMIYRQQRIRRILIIQLLTNALNIWLKNIPDNAFPANFIALAWTQQGKNILSRSEFSLETGRPKNADFCYTRKFLNRNDVEKFIKKLESRLKLQ